ncbi:MAG: phage tail assembly chaperone [Pseudomonadaceae bacterium]|nr:phage tail assembly chaperone [Pseudomonadaceae bacterium]
MSKFKLDPNPTFKAVVQIPVHGGESEPVVFEFKHRTRDQLDEFYKPKKERTIEEQLMDMIVGWDLDDEFNAENVAKLAQNFIGAATALVTVYVAELMQARTKN